MPASRLHVHTESVWVKPDVVFVVRRGMSTVQACRGSGGNPENRNLPIGYSHERMPRAVLVPVQNDVYWRPFQQATQHRRVYQTLAPLFGARDRGVMDEEYT